MKTLEQIKTYGGGESCNILDGRDKMRLLEFIPVADWEAFGFKVNPEAKVEEIKIAPLTYDNVITNLTSDLAFAFEKALDKRGISAGLMWDVIRMWMWVLDDELADFEDYAQYGLPLYKAVAVKYNLPNPIGDDEGTESKYAAEEI